MLFHSLQQSLGVIPQRRVVLPQFVNQEFSGHGASEPIVARTTLQTRDLIGAFPLSEEDRNRLVEVALSVQARLLACKEIADALGKAVSDAIGRVGDDGVVSEQSGRLVTIPGVPDLQPKAEMFLYQAKLAIRDIGQLYKPLVGQHFDQNFKTFADWALSTWGSDDALVQMLERDRPWIGRIISLRDAVEHPTHRRGPFTSSISHCQHRAAVRLLLRPPGIKEPKRRSLSFQRCRPSLITCSASTRNCWLVC